MSLINFSFVF